MNDRPLTWDRRDWMASAFLLIAPWLLFAPLLLPGDARQWFPSGDFVDQFYAFAHFETARFAAGELPLWNPYAYAGSPFWADVQAAVAYPPSLVVTLLSAWRWGELPFLALELEAVAHLSLAAVLTYAFARRALASRLGGLVAATSFGASGYLLGYPMLQLAVLETDAWLPLALLGAWRLAARFDGRRTESAPSRERRRGLSERWRALRPDPILALALGMALLAGHPQSALYVLYTSLAYAVWRAWIVPRARASTSDSGPSAAKRPNAGDTSFTLDTGSPRSRLSSFHLSGLRASAAQAWLLGLGGSLALAAGLSAAGWWPALEFLGLSNRAEAHYAMLSNGFPPQELLGLVLPGLTLWSPLYLGILPLSLAIAAIMSWGRAARSPQLERDPEASPSPQADTAFWLGLTLLSLLLSLGRQGFLFDLFYLFSPGFDLFRGQERAAFLTSFGLAMLAGGGASLWWRGSPPVARDLTRLAAGFSLAGAILAVVASPQLRAPALHLAVSSGGMALLVLAATWAGIGDRRRERGDGALGSREELSNRPSDGRPGRHSRPALWIGLLLLITLLDPWLALGRVNLAGQPPEGLRPSPILSFLDQDRPQRVDNEDRLPRNFGILSGIESTSGASPLRLRGFERLREALADLPPRWRDLMAVSHVLSWRERLDVESLVAMQAGEPESITYLHQLGWIGPFAWRASKAQTVGSDAEAAAALRDEDFQTLSEVILHAEKAAPELDDASPESPAAEAQALAPGSSSPGAASLSVRARRTGYARALTDGSAPAWVVFSETHYPGWQAWVDGESAPILRANLGQIAVPVPAGEHVVEIRFGAPRVQQGILLSLLSTLVLLTASLRLRRSARR